MATYEALAETSGHEVPLETEPIQVIVDNGLVFVPLRQVVEALGAKVDWDATSNTVTVT